MIANKDGGVLPKSSDWLASRRSARAAILPRDALRSALERTSNWLLARQTDLHSQLRAALHALHLGEYTSGEKRLLALSRRIMAGEHVGLRAAAPLLTEALGLLERARRR